MENKRDKYIGLTPKKLKEKVEPKKGELSKNNYNEFWGKLHQLCGTDNAKYAVFYFDFGIVFSLWDGKQFLYAPESKKLDETTFQYLQLARIFNTEKELKIWRLDNYFQYRLRNDRVEDFDSNADFDIIEADQVLWGTDCECTPVSLNGRSFGIDNKTFNEIYWTTLTEDRGTELTLPFPEKIEMNNDKASARICIKTWNYIDYLENGLATYVDSRFVDLVLK